MINSGEFETKEGLAKLDDMVKQERQLLSLMKLDLLKLMDAAFKAEQAARDILCEIQYCQMRINFRTKR